jgi:hypothetical protein
VERLEEWIQEALTRSDEETRDLMGKISASRSPRWKWELLTPTVLDLREYVRRLHIGTARPVAHFVHFTYTHYPVEFDGECRFRGHGREWFKSMQNRQGAREEARCVLKQAGQFVETLKALGAFDQSLVVLKSDHGKQRKYGEPGTMESEGIKDHWMLGYGRYRPFLAIKDFGPGHGGVRHDTHPVILDDLARTLCRNSGAGADCTAYPGYDLLGSDDLTGMESSEVTLFVVESPEADGRYLTHEGITVTRQTDIVASLCATLASEPDAPPVNCNES